MAAGTSGPVADFKTAFNVVFGIDSESYGDVALFDYGGGYYQVPLGMSLDELDSYLSDAVKENDITLFLRHCKLDDTD